MSAPAAPPFTDAPVVDAASHAGRPTSLPCGEPLPPDADLDLIADFVAESRAALASAEAMLLELETDPHRMESVNTVFRVFHTVKGTSSFLGLSLITNFTHHAETLLSRMRDREIVCAGGYADLALRSVDTLRLLLDAVDDARGGGLITAPRGYQSLVDALADPEAAGITAALADDTTAIPRLGDILVGFGRADRGAIEAALSSPGGQPAGLAIVQSGAASLTDVAHALRRQKHLSAERSAEPSTRVRTDHLDRLTHLVRELAVAQSLLAQDPLVADAAHAELGRRVTEVGRIVRDLEALSRATRMVPLRPTFQKLARAVQDVAQRTGKQVEFVVEGEDLQIDRTILDGVTDALLHMVRNAVDHGIERPDARTAAGKPPVGVVRLRATEASGCVVVELADDGRGLDRHRLARRAVERGIITSAEGMSDEAVFELIFAAGLSTAETVTDISGRGVGMDAARRAVESLRGRIDITSQLGRGSTFALRLPHGVACDDTAVGRVGTARVARPATSGAPRRA